MVADESSQSITSSKKREWTLIRDFPNLKDARTFLKSEGIYGAHYSDKSRITRYYRCKSATVRATKKCASMAKLVLALDSADVSLYHTISEHNHEQLEPHTRGVSAPDQEIIRDCMKKRMNTVQIKHHLRDINVSLKPRQLQTFMKGEKEKACPKIKLISDFEKWCRNNETVPDDEHQGFVAKFEVEYPKGEAAGKECRAFITTKHLLKNAEKSMVLHADGTYKLMTNGFPALVIGTSDANARFNLIGFCVCPGESQKDFEFIFKSFKEACEKFNVNINMT